MVSGHDSLLRSLSRYTMQLKSCMRLVSYKLFDQMCDYFVSYDNVEDHRA